MIIRAAGPSDAVAIQAIYAPVVIATAISFEVEPPDAAEMARRIETIGAHYPYRVAERDGKVIAYAYANRYQARAAYGTSVETTIYVAESARRTGVGHALYRALLGEIAALGYHRAIPGITLPNAPSVGLHEAMGFVPVGVFTEVGHKLGRYHDVGYWERAL